MKIPTREEFEIRWRERDRARELVRELEEIDHAWGIISKAELQRTDLIQMIGDLQEKLSKLNKEDK